MTYILACVSVCVCVSGSERIRVKGFDFLLVKRAVIGCYSYLSTRDKERLLAFGPNKRACDWVSGRITFHWPHSAWA